MVARVLESLWEGLVGLVQVSGGPGRERRNKVRLHCRYPVVVSCKAEGRERAFRSRVGDMGLIGMRLLGGERLKKDQIVCVTLVEAREGFTRDTVRCRVVWSRKQKECDDFCTGVLYEDSHDNLRASWVKHILKQLGFDEEHLYQKRSELRALADLPATVRVEDRDVEGRVLNVGAGGVLLAASAELRTGENVNLRIGPLGWLPPLRMEALVLGCTPGGDGLDPQYSLRFVKMGPARTSLLGKYVLKLLRDNPGEEP